MTTPDNLQRFLQAQEFAFDTALNEIQRGKKNSHWMWYIFPQIAGLGFSETSKFYAIKNATEAQQYLEHPLLRQRLVNISQSLLKLATNDAYRVFGSPDDMKLQSCMTLFASIPNADLVFQQVLDKYFSGQPDKKTLQLLYR